MSGPTTPRILTVHGTLISDWLADVARLRIRVFRDYPYLYDGSEAYETGYLRTYASCDAAMAVLACEGEAIVGASTGIPIAHETAAFR